MIAIIAPSQFMAIAPKTGGFELALLGSFDLKGPSGSIKLSNKKLAGLLAVLGCAGARGETREKLMTLLWGSHFEEQARQNLRQALTRLRRLLDPEAVVAEGDVLALAASLFACDAPRFEQLARAAGEQELELAVGLYRGPFLTDISIGEEAFVAWVDGERNRLEALATDALVKLAERKLQRKQAEAAQQLSAKAIAINGFREDARRLMMNALADLGRKADALMHFDRFASLLKQELGTEPDAATKALAAQLRALKPAQSLPHATPSVDKPAEGSAATCIAVVVRRATEEQSHEIARVLSQQKAALSSRSPAGYRTWMLETPTAIEGIRFALEVGGLSKASDRAAPQIGVAAHSGGHSSSIELTVALAEAADPGHVVATEDVRDHLVDGLDACVRDLGFVTLARNQGSVRVFAIDPPPVSVVKPQPDPNRFKPLIAVLPFDTPEAGPAASTLGELLAEEIIGACVPSGQLDMLSRLSTRQLSKRAVDLGQMRAHLGADFVVSGRVRSSGGRAEVAFELTDANSRAVNWVQVREVALSDPQDIRQTAASIAVEVLAAIMARETTRASSAPMSKLESYTLLFAAIALMDRWTRNSFLKSRELLSELRQRAPLHALPCAWRSAWHIRSISQGWTTDAAADARAALEFAERSLDSDPNCSIALTMEGWANVYASRRLDLAANRLLRAVEVNPSDSLAWLLKGVTHAFCGEGQDAADAAERALRLSPLDPRRSYFESMAAGANLAAHRFERTIELATSSLRANSQHPSTLRALATGLWYSDRPEQARKCVEQMLALEPSFSVSRYRGSHPASGQPVIELVAEALAACGAPA